MDPSRKENAGQLIEYLKSDLLSRLGDRDNEVLSWFERYSDVKDTNGDLSLTFEFMHLFNAVVHFSDQAGIGSPVNPDWSNQLKEFAKQLMQRWPSEAFHAAGLDIRLIHKTSSHTPTKYEIFSV